MSVSIVPHLNFSREARQALEFYQDVFGGELTIVTYGDFGQAPKPADADLVIWGQVSAPSGFKVMAFDAEPRVAFHPGENAYYVSARFDNAEEATACWQKLQVEATVRQPLGPAPWAAVYGMLQDRFGVVWIVDVVAA